MLPDVSVVWFSTFALQAAHHLESVYCSAPSQFCPGLGLLVVKLDYSRDISASYLLHKVSATHILNTQMFSYADEYPTSWNRRTFSFQTLSRNLHPLPQPAATMCRQFYRHCRDCHKMFSMAEPGMRELCKEFQKALFINPCLVECPGGEIQVIRPPSGHGAKVCGSCKKTNREAQRDRENAQKRARRAKLKREKMTAGMGAGNVLWTAPNTWIPNIMDTQILPLYSPQPRRPGGCDILKVRSTTHALQYALNGSISMATMTQDHINVSHQEHEVYSRSCPTSAATSFNDPHPQEYSQATLPTEMCEKINLRHLYEIEPQNGPTKQLDEPFSQAEKCQPVGLGITVANDAELGPNHTEACSFNEWGFRMELNQWSTVFDEDDDDGIAKEL